jgi:predicted HTH domain antitoxin
MNLTIPDEILQAAQLTAVDIKRELALLFLQRKALNVEQASQLADIHPIKFEQLLVQRQISAPLKFKKLSKLQERDCIIGDPEDLVHFDWAKEWNN